jgi:hypothetical protein
VDANKAKNVGRKVLNRLPVDMRRRLRSAVSNNGSSGRSESLRDIAPKLAGLKEERG